MSWKELKFSYSYYRYFIEFLVKYYGIKKLQEYLKAYINKPENYNKIFVKVYSNDLDEILKKYIASLKM